MDLYANIANAKHKNTFCTIPPGSHLDQTRSFLFLSQLPPPPIEGIKVQPMLPAILGLSLSTLPPFLYLPPPRTQAILPSSRRLHLDQLLLHSRSPSLL
ncbi:MAG: hypothetical protein A2284_03925 [Deltaproteobacteria bacterium RIFOXYA12_FULL_61_11]|nr:MAG: hypothetical protein A2284_03925 [Deltaproteobacteria bacterium RIFOXYA12_FULL_61_11]